MSKFRVFLQNSKSKYVLFGFIFEWRVDPIEYYPDTQRRTTIAFVPPGKQREGISSRVWGYNRTTPIKPKEKSIDND